MSIYRVLSEGMRGSHLARVVLSHSGACGRKLSLGTEEVCFMELASSNPTSTIRTSDGRPLTV